MAVAGNSGVNISAAIAGMMVPSNTTSATLPPISHGVFLQIPFTDQVVGVMQIVYSYGGAMLFIEFMAEMRRPRDFWKGMVIAQLFIFVVYMLFGLVSCSLRVCNRLLIFAQVIYAFQGQYTINPANQGLAPFAWQTATNIISFIAALIAAGLYGK